MTAILELPEVRQRISLLSIEEYHRLDEFNENGKRTEFIRGIVFEKMSKSPLHATIATRLFKLVLRLVPTGFSVRLEQPLTLSDSEPEPDVAVVRGQDSDFTNTHPTTAALVIEIAASSAGLDRALASVYAEAGVGEYWIVLAQERAVEVYRQLVNGMYQEKKAVAEGTLTCANVSSISVPLSSLFV